MHAVNRNAAVTNYHIRVCVISMLKFLLCDILSEYFYTVTYKYFHFRQHLYEDVQNVTGDAARF